MYRTVGLFLSTVESAVSKKSPAPRDESRCSVAVRIARISSGAIAPSGGPTGLVVRVVFGLG